MDCNDVYEVLIKPAAPAPTNKALSLYLGALRSDKETGRVRSWIWLDTKDMLANSLTKVESDGTVAWEDLRQVLVSSWWQPSRVWRLNGIKQAPLAPIANLTPPAFKLKPVTYHGTQHALVFPINDEDYLDDNFQQSTEQEAASYEQAEQSSDPTQTHEHGNLWYSYDDAELPLMSTSVFHSYDELEN